MFPLHWHCNECSRHCLKSPISDYSVKGGKRCWHFSTWSGIVGRCNFRSLAPPCTGISLLRWQGPAQRQSTKCRTQWNHVTPLCTENNLQQKQPATTRILYYKLREWHSSFLKRSTMYCWHVVYTPKSSCFWIEIWRPFCANLRRKERDTSYNVKNRILFICKLSNY